MKTKKMIYPLREKIALLKESLSWLLKDYKNRDITNKEVLEKLNYATDDFENDLLKIAEDYNIDSFNVKHTINK